MKKSTLIAGMAILGSFLTLTSANLKLKQEYKAGNIRKVLVEKKLPSFHFIKETLDRHIYYGGSFVVTNHKDQANSVSFSLNAQGRILFDVANDTLYIKNNPLDKDNQSLNALIYINDVELKNITTTSGTFTIAQEKRDSFSIIARGVSKISLTFSKLNKLSIRGFDDAKITVSAPDTLSHAYIQMEDRSIFEATDLVINQKIVKLGIGVSLQLRGHSLENFGVKRN